VERKITFYHEGCALNAQAFYSEKDLQTILLLLPHDLIDGLNKSILFLKDKNTGWKTISSIGQAHPKTIRSIISALEDL